MRSRLTPDSRRGGSSKLGRGIATLFVLTTLVLGLAACGSDSSSSSVPTSTSASSSPGTGKPAVTIADQNFPEQKILGQLYAHALDAKGYNITLLSELDSSKAIFKAFTLGQVEMYPEYIGAFLTAIAGETTKPTSVDDAYKQAKAFAETKGATMLNYTPFYNSRHQNVAPIVKKSLLDEEGPEFAATINKVSALLTIPAIQQMNKAVTIENQPPKTVAIQFLKAHGLV